MISETAPRIFQDLACSWGYSNKVKNIAEQGLLKKILQLKLFWDFAKKDSIFLKFHQNLATFYFLCDRIVIFSEKLIVAPNLAMLKYLGTNLVCWDFGKTLIFCWRFAKLVLYKIIYLLEKKLIMLLIWHFRKSVF